MSSLSLSLFLCFRFYLYKLPKQHGEKYHNGEKYLLLHRGSVGWTEGTETVNDTTGALGRTVGQLYAQREVCIHLVEKMEQMKSSALFCRDEKQNYFLGKYSRQKAAIITY